MKICSAAKARHGLHYSASNLSIAIRRHDSSYCPQSSQQNPQVVSQSLPLTRDGFETLFISALVQASSCRRRERDGTSWPPTYTFQRPNFGRKSTCHRAMHTQMVSPKRQVALAPEISREEYTNLLDYYRGYSTQDDVHEEGKEDSSTVVPNKQNELLWRATEEAHSSKDDIPVDNAISDVIAAIDDQSTSLEQIFNLYRVIPRPRVESLPYAARTALLHRLSTAQVKTPRSTLRFLSVMDDMKSAGLGIPRPFWNSAVHLAGRTLGFTSSPEVEQALRKWKEMEQDAGITGSSITFNILLDIAVKAGQFSLAEMVLDEMKARGVRLDRFTRVGIIYYCGVREDGDGIRKSYKDLVETGDIVDTTVLNCVIASLFRAGESTAAEHVYSRMKALHAKSGGKEIGFSSKKSLKQVAQSLQKFAKQYKNHPTLLKCLQAEQMLAPDTKTFIILIGHHVSKTGRMSAVAKYLDEMQAFGVPVHGRIFHELFRGFALHGGVRYTLWSEHQLRSVWVSFLNLSNQGIENVYWGRWLVIWILRAFSKCSGEDAAKDIWSIIKPKWPDASEHEEFMLSIIDRARPYDYVETRYL